MKQSCIAALACMAFLSGVSAGVAAESAVNAAPMPDAAILPYPPGLKPVEGVTPIGNAYKHNEGVVIRQSRIENGKIIIPPSGLYYTNRGPRSYMLRCDVLNMLGKPYYLVATETQAGVLVDKAMKPGDRVHILPDKVLVLTEIKAKGNGHPTPVVNFAVLRPSGVPVGGVGSVTSTPLSHDVKDFKLSGRKTGIHPLTGDFRFDIVNYTTDLAAGASKSIKVKDLTDEGAFVKEAMFHGPKAVYVSTEAPKTGYFGPGDSFPLGDFTVSVVDVQEKDGTAKLRLTGKDGKSMEKTLGPIPEAIAPLLINAELEAREALSLRDADTTVQVEISPWRRTPAFRNGKVALNGYEKVQRFYAEMPWAADTRFMYRPDT